MKELEIKIKELKEDIQEIENKCCKLLSYGNVPESNWNPVYNLLQLRMNKKEAFDTLIEVSETIESNRPNPL